MNIHSSRSHAIFTVAVECSEKGIDGNNHLHVGRLNLVWNLFIWLPFEFSIKITVCFSGGFSWEWKTNKEWCIGPSTKRGFKDQLVTFNVRKRYFLVSRWQSVTRSISQFKTDPLVARFPWRKCQNAYGILWNYCFIFKLHPLLFFWIFVVCKYWSRMFQLWRNFKHTSLCKSC